MISSENFENIMPLIELLGYIEKKDWAGSFPCLIWVNTISIGLINHNVS